MSRLSFTILAVVLIATYHSTKAESCQSGGSSHDAFFGQRQPGDELLFMDHPKLVSKFMRVTTYDILYPPRGETPGNISYIEIYDQRSDGTGGCAFLQDGGIGQNYVKLHLKSQRNHGMEFSVKIYGRKNHW